MKLYNSIGPNPRIVRMFMAEKGLEVDKVEVDIMAGENRKPPYNQSVNRTGQCPALELDDGAIITEITAICDYLEELNPEPVLFGTNALERATSRMWNRRIDLNITEYLANGFRYSVGKQIFEGRMRLIPHAADDLIALGNDGLNWLNGEMEGRNYISGDQFRMPDILLFGWLDFLATVGQELDPELKNISAWFKRVQERPSVAASA